MCKVLSPNYKLDSKNVIMNMNVKEGDFMKKIINLLFVFSIILNIFSPLLVKANTIPTKGIIVSNPFVNLRRDPNTSRSPITTINLNEVIDIIGQANDGGGCGGNIWYQVVYKEFTGFVCSSFVQNYSVTPATLDERFPESYRERIAILKALRPNWKFEPFVTNIEWNDLIQGQNSLGKNLVNISSTTTLFDGWKNVFSYNFETNKFNNSYQGGGTNWFAPSDQKLAFYLDPRNFINERHIFMFEQLSFNYDSYTEEEILLIKNGIQNMLNGTVLSDKPNIVAEDIGRTSSYADIFMEAARVSGVNPYSLVARVRLELGIVTGRNIMISGNANVSVYEDVVDANGNTVNQLVNYDFSGYFNFYNIGATGATDRITFNGLNRAKTNNWNSEYTAIIEGAKFIGSSYVEGGQDTLYTQKFDIIPPSLYSKQYMQNIYAPSTEAVTTFGAYQKENLLDQDFTFKIPIYLNMPTETKIPDPRSAINYLSDIKVDGKTLLGFNKDNQTYNLNVSLLKSNINITASSNATVNILGTGTLELVNTNTVHYIDVAALNGDVRRYTINIMKTASEYITVNDLLDASKVSYSETSIRGILPSTNFDDFKTNLAKQSSDVVVTLKDLNGNNKTGGVIGTGDIVTITLGAETKEINAIVLGDLNGDGAVTIVDLLRTQRIILNMSNIQSALAAGGDVNQDGRVTILDLLRIQKHILGIEVIR
jgi:beta-N-acetylglucosaminidase